MTEVTIRPIELEDTENIVRWRNTDSVRKNLYTQEELKPEQHIAYFQNVVRQGKCAQFIISVNENGMEKDIGTVFIKNIDHKSHNGEYGIFIGEESARGKGYAKRATRLILDHGFSVLKLHRIYLTVMADNHPAVKAYEGCGFQREGVMRDEYLRDDGYVDVVLMAILQEDWEKRKDCGAV